RSSALASKATGFPIAKIAAKLAVGYTLDELKNDITGGATPASFEPSIDYVVTKIPRFDFEKFRQSDDTLTTQMKSVGEVMAVGRDMPESLQKAMRSLEIGSYGFEPQVDLADKDALAIIREQLRVPKAKRLWYIGDAFRAGIDFDEIQELTGIDPWFLAEIEGIIISEEEISDRFLDDLCQPELLRLKAGGFSDVRLANLLGTKEQAVRDRRAELGVHPVYKRVDSCAAEFATATAYMYSSYDEECEAEPSNNDKIMVLGGGPNRIGQGIEFDYCCVHAAMSLRKDGFETIMVNCNPETVSTDYDTSDRLYFEPLTLEDVLEITRVENPGGVIVQYGGQTPLKLARPLKSAGVNIIGTSPEAIHAAEDREEFQSLIEQLGLRQPPNRTASSEAQALTLAEEIGYPLVVRPSYVLGGRAMEIVHGVEDLRNYMKVAINVSNDSPVLLDRFLNDAIEVDVDAICDGKDVLIGGVMEHIEEAGVHSGDSACSLPPFSLHQDIQDQLRDQTRQMAHALKVLGLMNVQFAVKGSDIYVLEVNPRASRTAPFVSKATSIPLATVAARVMAGKSLVEQGYNQEIVPNYYAVKEAVFPFIKFPGVDTILGPEMKSTGEVMGVGETFGEAFDKAQQGAGMTIPTCGEVFLSVRKPDRDAIVIIGQYFAAAGFRVFATKGTARALTEQGVSVEVVNKVKEGPPHIVDRIKNGQVSLIVNTTEGKQSIADSYTIRREALMHKVTYYTTVAGARAACDAHKAMRELNVNRLQDLHKGLMLLPHDIAEFSETGSVRPLDETRR
ncbi:MAG: carbamoyl-phosphate synthase large subunit, partial [Proteobacteria bacterium]|nr:carbamoyl-phosphate synthase large subunit [Pseudomonadota bacterium]